MSKWQKRHALLMKEFVEYGSLYLLLVVHIFLFSNSHQSGGFVFSSHDSNFTFFFLSLLFEIEPNDNE